MAAATFLGLFPAVAKLLENMASTLGHGWELVARALYVLFTVTCPGAVVGTVAAMFVVPGLTTDERRDQAMIIASFVVNMAIFGAGWFVMRSSASGSRRRRTMVTALAIWLVLALCLGVFGALWMVL